MKWKQFFLIVAVSTVSALGSVWCYSKFVNPQSLSVVSADSKLPVNYAGFIDKNNVAAPGEPVDFTQAADAAVPAVVHIKTKIPAKKASNQLPRNRNGGMDDFFDQFFNFGPSVIPEQRGSGSGVIISEDGYIVTNNHVVADGENGTGIADEISVTLSNKKTYKARVIGRDASTDLAVLKIDGNGFPYLVYGNSDKAKLGQWVLAVGYPLTLETTVTAGIISAKGRAIGINQRQSQTPVESFIQTDAAVNQGNSGGALINTNGELIGINSAILAPSGTYAGYSFAIPINLVKKIVNDLVKFGDVKRPYLGIQAAQDKFDAGDGAHIGSLAKDGAAAEAGLKPGDIITKINDVPINSWTELQGTVTSNNVGEKMKIAYKRDGKDLVTTATLKTMPAAFEEVAKVNVSDKLGATIQTLDEKTAKKNNIEGGVIVTNIKAGGPFNKARIQEGFIITSVDGVDINNVEEFKKALSNSTGTVQLEGIFDGWDGVYKYPLNLEENK
ncbi:MAG: serine protease [Chitinophagaceae bacterium]|nr:serine protease [Chitinophagaceae bacterium]